MKDLQISIDRLSRGRSEMINYTCDPSLIGVHEAELDFRFPLEIEGSAYLADDTLIIKLSIETQVMIPCSVCNEEVIVDLYIGNHYDSIPLSDLRARTIDITPLLREAVLLSTPRFTECSDGQCPQRTELNKYSCSQSETGPVEEEGYKPFADL
jgi:uncharacterized metal-binding protein YceD (DUF177 family)